MVDGFVEVFVGALAFFIGDVAVAVFRVEVRFTVIVVVVVGGRLVFNGAEVTRDDICLFAVSFICLSIIGDFTAGTRGFAAPADDPVVAGAVFGLKTFFKLLQSQR